MKKLLLSVVAVLAFGFSNAQSNEEGTMHASLRGGFGFGTGTYKSNGISSKNTNAAVAYGIDFQYGLSEKISAGVGIEGVANVFTPKGADFADDVNTTLAGFKFKLNGRYYFVNKDRFNFYGGPSVGYTTLKNVDYSNLKYNGLNYGVNSGVNFYFADFIGANVELGYEGNSLKGDDSVKLAVGGVRIMAGVAFKF